MARRSLVLAAAVAVVVVLAPHVQAEDEWMKAWKEGKHHFRLRDYPQALAAWERSAKLNPREMSTHANMAKCLSYMKRYAEAVVEYDKALSLGVRGAAAGNLWGDKGVCLRHLKSYTKAIEAYKKAQELEPGQYLHWHALGNVLSDIGHSEEAIAAWKKSLELNPIDPETEEAIETEELKLHHEVRPFPSTVEEIVASRERSAALDLEGALQALGDGDRTADPLKSEVAEIEARRAYLDAVGAAAPGAIVIALEAGKRAKLVSASARGVQVEGVDSVVPWPALPRGSAIALIAATEKSVKGAPLGAALVLYDLGLWPQGDQRTKAWVDSEPGSAQRAEAIVARYRGLADAPRAGFLWKNNEWLTPEEDDARSHDVVTVEGKPIAREDARRLAEKQRAERKVARRSQVAEAKARSEKLLKEHGVTDVKTILSSGDPLKRADVVVVADGFTSSELPNFERLADSIAKTVLTIEPFKNYARYVNVHRVSVVAEQSGLAGSRLGAKVGSNKTLTCDRDLARSYGQFAPDADLVIVCANVKDVRATGGHGVITIDVSGELGEVFLHEMGHAFAALDDEYVDATSIEGHSDYDSAQERFHINTTRETNPKKSKWHYWLLPPALPKDQEVGCVQGAFYRDKGYYRPCQNCRMKSESVKRGYCPVCLEQVEKSFYSRIEPIDDVNVRAPDVDLYKDDATKLEATAIAISGEAKLGGFSARWFVDDRPAPAAAVKSAGVKTELALKTLNLPPGPHEALLRVDLKDTRVRRDGGLLSSLRAWRVNVADAARPKIGSPDRVTATRGELVSFDIALEGGTPDQRLDVDGPGGSSFVQTADRSGRFVWCPPRNARGLFHIDISIGYGETQIRRVTEILLQDPTHNVPPVLRDQGLVLAIRGRPLVLRLETFDADGDELLYSVKKLPPGATLNTALGLLRWTPGYSSPFDAETEIVVRVSDGLSEDELAFKIKVDNKPIENSGPAFDVLQATRSTSAEVRTLAVAALLESDLPRGGKLLELARLLRDPEPEVAKKACEELAGALEVSEKSARGLVAIDLADHVWDLADRPEALAFLKELLRYLFNPEAEAASAKIQKDLAAVESYNRDRGAP